MKFFKKPWVIIVIIIIALTAFGIYRYATSNKGPQYQYATVHRANLVQSVSVTGRVTPAENVDLAFEKSGKVVSVNAAVGDTVTAGETLVSLDATDLRAQLLQYQATAESQRARLDELRKGTRPEEISIAQITVDNAQKALTDANTNLTNVQDKATNDLGNLYQDVNDVLNDAYTKADDAVTKQTDELFINDTSFNPSFSFVVSDSGIQDLSQTQRHSMTILLAEFQTDLAGLGASPEARDAALTGAESRLLSIRTFLDTMITALNASVNVSSTTLAGYKASVNTGRTNINTALTNINTKRQEIASQRTTNANAIDTAKAQVRTAQNTLASAQAQLVLKQAGSTPEAIAAQEALLKQAQANVVSAESQLAKMSLTAPIAGTVTKQDGKVGQIVSASTLIASIISASQFEIQANVPEADIAKIQVGNPATVTLDAYSNDVVFDAAITKIDPAETIIDGVATYQVTLQFTKEDPRIRPGMTANVDVETAKRENVLIVPQRAISRKNNADVVQVADDTTPRDVTVTTGLKGSDGNIEILSGLNEGDKIILFTK